MTEAAKFLAQPCGNMCIKSHRIKDGWLAPGIDERGGDTPRFHGKDWKMENLHKACLDISSKGTL
jgi:hypothetical protein